MTLGLMATDIERRIDFEAMRRYKVARVLEQFEKRDLGAVLCFDTDNIRYITGTNLGEWNRDKFIRYCILPRDGEPILFEVGTAREVKKDLCPWLKTGNIRPGVGWLRGANVPGGTEVMLKACVESIKGALEENKVAGMPVGVDILDLYILTALQDAGLEVVNGWDVLWDARVIKSPDELKIIETSASLVDGCYEHVVELIRPGVKECEIVGEIYGWLIKCLSSRSHPGREGVDLS